MLASRARLVLITLGTNEVKMPDPTQRAPLVKKIPNFLTTLVPLLLNMMLDIPVRRIALAPFG